MDDYTSFKPNPGETIPTTVPKTQTFFNVGAGLTAGYQVLFGKDNKWSVDVNLGAKLVSNVPVPDDAMPTE